jgi:hypothetical protein
MIPPFLSFSSTSLQDEERRKREKEEAVAMEAAAKKAAAGWEAKYGADWKHFFAAFQLMQACRCACCSAASSGP